MDKLQKKREREKRVVADMISLYCARQHGTRGGKLCPECAALRDYAQTRSDHCPRMEEKTFCVNCQIHCYKPEMREKIKQVMRYSGPRMLLHHPLLAISHMVSVMRERKRLHN